MNRLSIRFHIQILTFSIVSLLKSRQQSRAEAILTILYKTGNFNWNSHGEIMYNGATVQNSHIVDLISFATKLHPTKRINLVGLPTFVQIIKDNHVPRDLLSSQFNQMLEDKKCNKRPSPYSKSKWIKFKEYK